MTEIPIDRPSRAICGHQLTLIHQPVERRQRMPREEYTAMQSAQGARRHVRFSRAMRDAMRRDYRDVFGKAPVIA